jgi:hypothetical protein
LTIGKIKDDNTPLSCGDPITILKMNIEITASLFNFQFLKKFTLMMLASALLAFMEEKIFGALSSAFSVMFRLYLVLLP